MASAEPTAVPEPPPQCFLCRTDVAKDGVGFRARGKVLFYACQTHAQLVRGAKEITSGFIRELVHTAVKRLTGIALEEFTSVE